MGINFLFFEGFFLGGRIFVFNRQTYVYNLFDSDLSVREKKKKVFKLIILRKRFIRFRRYSRLMDYGKVLREMIFIWLIREFKLFIQEYEVLVSFKELVVVVNIVRLLVNILKQDLVVLFDFKCCIDINLVYKGVCFSVYRVILLVRSFYFRDLLNRYLGIGCQIFVKLRIIGVDVVLFVMLLRYFYIDEISFYDFCFDY